MTIGIIGAMQMEMDALKEAMTEISAESISGVNFMTGKIGERKVVAAVSGVGKVFAAICTEAMILHFHPDLILNIGVAGTLTRDLNVLDVAIADNLVQHDMDTSAVGDPVGLLSGINMILLPADAGIVRLLGEVLNDRGIHYKKGTIATGDQFIARKEQKETISHRFEAIAAEMEGGAIAQVCYMNQVPFGVIRSISDGEGAHLDYQTFAGQAADQSVEIVLDLLERI